MVLHQVFGLQRLVAARTLVVTPDALADAFLAEPVTAERDVRVIQVAHAYGTTEEVSDALNLPAQYKTGLVSIRVKLFMSQTDKTSEVGGVVGLVPPGCCGSGNSQVV